MATVFGPDSGSVGEIRKVGQDDCVIQVHKFLNRKLRKWSDVEVNIGITGDSGTGKSSFINAIRGVPDDHETAAPVGVTETTTQPICYALHENPNIRFWDLPGIGTPRFTNNLEEYCERVELRNYNSYLIFASSRFTQNDLRLAKKIRSFDRTFFFIRTKVDTDIRAEKRKKSFNEELTLRKIRRDCANNLAGVLPDENVFLISNHDTTKWDFARLTQAIFDLQFERKRDSLISYFTSLSVA